MIQFLIGLGGIWHDVETIWTDETDIHFILVEQYSRRIVTRGLFRIPLNAGLHLNI